MASWTLGQVVEEPPLKKDLNQLDERDIETWKGWWESHQQEYP